MQQLLHYTLHAAYEYLIKKKLETNADAQQNGKCALGALKIRFRAESNTDMMTKRS